MERVATRLAVSRLRTRQEKEPILFWVKGELMKWGGVHRRKSGCAAEAAGESGEAHID